MRLYLHPTARRQAWGIAILRVVVGSVFLVHGAQKLFVQGIPAVAEFMTQVGIPLPLTSALLLTSAEFFCGLALVAGLLTRWAAVPLAIVMVVAIRQVHLSAGFFMPNGFEYALTLFGVCVALTCLGPGALAIDNWLATDRDGSAARTASVGRAA